MTRTVDLTPEQEERLHREAQGRGLAAALFRQLVDQTLAQIAATPQKPKPRVLGLHAGQWWIADDFDDPLPDSFWLGEDGGPTPGIGYTLRGSRFSEEET